MQHEGNTDAATLPLWFSLTGGVAADHTGRPRVGRGLIVREYDSVINGVHATKPSYAVLKTGSNKAALELVLPSSGVQTLKAGDYVQGLVEVILIPQKAVDHFSPNTALQAVIAQATANDEPWLPYRVEAANNNLNVVVSNGKGSLERSFPPRVRVDQTTGKVEFTVEVVGNVAASPGLVLLQVSGVEGPPSSLTSLTSTDPNGVVFIEGSDNTNFQVQYN